MKRARLLLAMTIWIVAVFAAIAAAPGFHSLPMREQSVLASAQPLWPSLDSSARADLLRHARDWLARTPQQQDQLRQHLWQWDRQPAPVREQRRTAFRAWQRLSPSDQQTLRAAAQRVAALPPLQQQQLHAQFAALPIDAQRAWWLGPSLGRNVAPMISLFAFVPEAERPALLELLGSLDAQARADLMALAPRLNEGQRQSLRQELLAASPMQRGQLIRQRLAQ